jgi:hypothetical protein
MAGEDLDVAFNRTRLLPSGHDDYALDEEEDDELLEGEDQALTEDDPVDLAMRVATADTMEMDESDEEQIVYKGLNQGSLTPFVYPAVLFAWKLC